MTDAGEGGVLGGPDHREELRGRIRDDDLPDDAKVALRGGPDTESLIRSHARRANRLFVLDGEEVWALSVFVALDDVGPGSAQVILRTKLRSYARVYMPTVGSLRQAGFEVLATFARPHFSVVMPGLGSAEDLLAALGELHINPYAGG